jgi:hypothetical protein
MNEERCPVTELIVSQCAHCRRLPVDPFADTESPKWFTARYDGTCAQCGQRLVPGQTIGAGDDHGFICSHCGGE